jgi:hypothetical protein
MTETEKLIPEEVVTPSEESDNKSKGMDIEQIRKQNPGVKIKKLKNGGFQLYNPRAPSPLLTKLLQRIK